MAASLVSPPPGRAPGWSHIRSRSAGECSWRSVVVGEGGEDEDGEDGEGGEGEGST